MNKIKLLKGFYFITDSRLSLNGNIIDAELALKANAKIIQLREKTRKEKEYYSEAIEISKLCKKYNALFIVNDDFDLAIKTNADGIHLGQNDNIDAIAPLAIKEKRILGISTCNLKEALQAEKLGAEYIAVGHIFPTKTKKKEYNPVGLNIIREIKKKVKLPIVAIGGINHNNASRVIEMGADMICAISDSLKNGTVKENLDNYEGLFKR